MAAGVGFAAVGYTVLVVTVGRLVEGRTSGFWLSLLGTAIVALAFQPLRRSIVRLANRMAYGERAQPYEALADFSRDLARSPSPDTLLPAVAEAAGRAVSAPRVGRHSRRARRRAGHRHLGIARGGTVAAGSRAARRRRPRQHRRRRCRAVAPCVPRTADCCRTSPTRPRWPSATPPSPPSSRAHVAELDRATHQLVESRLRIIAADDAARRTLEATIAREVLPHLATLPDDIRRERAAVRDGAPGPGIERLVDGTNTALESLRDLTRGVFPTQLARSGIEPALRSFLGRSASSAQLLIDPSVAGQRFAPRVEAAVYFCCVEAVRTAEVTVIELALDGERLCQRVHGVAGLDLQAVEDRVEAVGGTLALADDVLEVSIPVGTAPAYSRVVEGAVPGGG